MSRISEIINPNPIKLASNFTLKEVDKIDGIYRIDDIEYHPCILPSGFKCITDCSIEKDTTTMMAKVSGGTYFIRYCFLITPFSFRFIMELADVIYTPKGEDELIKKLLDYKRMTMEDVLPGYSLEHYGF